MLEDWTIDLAAGTATHNPSGLVLELMKEDPNWPLMRARPDTVDGLVEQLLREGTIAFRHVRNRGR